MGKIGEYEKTIVVEPLEEPLPLEKIPKKTREEPLHEPVKEPKEISK